MLADFLNAQIEQLDTEIIKYYETFECYLHTIPGVGIIAAAGAVTHKLTTVIYAVLRDGKPYEAKKFV